MEKNDGGPAFPHNVVDRCGGMTLRDYFAGQAMVACVAQVTDPPPKVRPSEIAKFAYACADAMLAERTK